MANNTITLNTEIRKLKPVHRYALGDILNISDSWKKLMAIIPRNDVNTTKFTSEHVSILEQAAQKYRQNAAEILLDEWGTMGKERPTLQILLDLLIKAELFRAADYVASEILNVDLPQRPEYGPAAIVDISDETLANLINKQIKLGSDEYDESISIYESSCEVNAGEIRYFPDVIDLMDPCILNNDLHDNESDKVILQSTEQDLIKFSTNKLSNKDILQNDAPSDKMILKSKENDLIMFSTNKLSSTNIVENLKIVDTKEEDKFRNSQTSLLPSVECKLEEMSSQELPAFINNLEQDKHTNNNELKSEELPIFLNQDSFVLNKSTCTIDNNSTHTTNSSNSSNSSHCNSNYSNSKSESNMSCALPEATFSLLPQYVIDQQKMDSELSQKNENNINVMNSTDLPLMVLEYNR